MKKYYLGTDLGSTTSKAVIVSEDDRIVGRGITNTRANYKVAAEIAKQEAIFDARFNLLENQLEDEMKARPEFRRYIRDLRATFRFLQFRMRMDRLHEGLRQAALIIDKESPEELLRMIDTIVAAIVPRIRKEFLEGGMGERNEFFRDIVNEKYLETTNEQGKAYFEKLMLAFDKSITPVENEIVDYDFKALVFEAMDMLSSRFNDLAEKGAEGQSVNFDAELNLLMGNFGHVSDSLRTHISQVADYEISISNMVGTGYGRALLPFPEDCIKSEILCHAFGAHAVFPNTRTVLDIGGQDTKAIQVDSYGLVTSFHMNDRCAAGCGRYLGYIADEFSISLNELGPLANEAEKEVNICSTCTVFAGAEVRELLNIGERREDILAGLHKAIVMRAMSLLARSGGVRNEFTFTGGVARNPAVLKYVGQMVKDSYGHDIKINIHPDSIFMGALGAAMFARRNMAAVLPPKSKSPSVMISETQADRI